MGLVMFKKLKLLSFVLIVFLLFISCVEEPTISPVKRAYSMLRVANLTTNLDQIDVKIYTEIDEIDLQVNDVKTIADLNKNQFTEYFDVWSGKRQVQVIEKVNNQVIFDKSIDATAYAELIWYFSGYYHPDIDSTTFNFFSTQEGETFLDGTASFSPDSLAIVFLHAAGDTPSDSAKAFYVLSNFTVAGDTAVQDTLYHFSAADSSVSFGEQKRVKAKEGEYSFYMINEINGDTLATFENQTMDAGKKSFLLVTGEPDNMVVERKDIDPLPAEPK